MTRLICATADHNDLGNRSSSLALCLYPLRSSNYIHPASLPTLFLGPLTCWRNLQFCACRGHSVHGFISPEKSLTHLCSVSALPWPQTWMFLTLSLISSPYDPVFYFFGKNRTDPQLGQLLYTAFPLSCSWLVSHSISPFFFCIPSEATSLCFSSATNIFALHGVLSFDLFKKYFGHAAWHVKSQFLNHRSPLALEA